MAFETARILAAVVAVKDGKRPKVKTDAHYSLDAGTDSNPGSTELMARRIEPDDLLSAPVSVATLGGRKTLDTSLDRSLEFHIIQSGDAFGVALWIDTGPDGGSVGHDSGATGTKTSIDDHRQVVFSWPAIVNLSSGDNVKVNLRAERLANECEWYWDSLIRKVESGKIQGIRYRQSTTSPLLALNCGPR